jgi:hypothetical protein
LSQETDLAYEFSGKKKLPPLPTRLLGLDPQLEFVVNHFRIQHGDQLLLFSRSLVPKDLFSLSSKKADLEHITKISSQNDADLPFWLGTWRLA